MLLQHCTDHLQTDSFQLLCDLKRASKLISNWLAAYSKANLYKLGCKQNIFLPKTVLISRTVKFCCFRHVRKKKKKKSRETVHVP